MLVALVAIVINIIIMVKGNAFIKFNKKSRLYNKCYSFVILIFIRFCPI